MSAWQAIARAGVVWGLLLAVGGERSGAQTDDKQVASELEEEATELLEGNQSPREGYFRKALFDAASGGSEALEFVLRNTARRFDAMADALLERHDQGFPVGLEGYCPVTLQHEQRWQRGDARWSKAFEGCTYYFAGPRERDLFAAKPKSYAPAAGGNDLVVLAETGKTVPGHRSSGVWYRDRIYLFRDESSLKKFSTAPDIYLQKKAPRAADPLSPASPVAEKFHNQPFEGAGLAPE